MIEVKTHLIIVIGLMFVPAVDGAEPRPEMAGFRQGCIINQLRQIENQTPAVPDKLREEVAVDYCQCMVTELSRTMTSDEFLAAALIGIMTSAKPHELQASVPKLATADSKCVKPLVPLLMPYVGKVK